MDISEFKAGQLRTGYKYQYFLPENINNYGEFAIIKSQAGLNNYKISVKKWTEKTKAVGLKATVGRYGGTYAHKDIAFENLNALFINERLLQSDRLIKLNKIAIHQMRLLTEDSRIRKLESGRK